MLETDLPFVSLWYAIGGHYAERRRRVADDRRRAAAFADHRLRAAHDRHLHLARGAGVLDADRRAHPRPGSNSRRATWMSDPRPSTSSPPSRCSRAETRQTWPSWHGCCVAAQLGEGELLWRQGERGARDGVRSSTEDLRCRSRVPGRSRRSRSRAPGPGEMRRRDRAARRRRALDERARDRDHDGAGAQPGRLRRAARAATSVRVRAQAPARRRRRRAASQPARDLAASLGGEDLGRPPAEDAERLAELEYCGPPDSKYVRRMATFHDFDSLALWGFLTAGRVRPVPGGPHARSPKARPRPPCYLTINGAVEKVLVRGDRRIRVGLAGPGQGVRLREPDRRPALARDRDHARAGAAAGAARGPFEQLFNGE